VSADFNAVAEAVLGKAKSETQVLHDLAKQIKAKSGNSEAVKSWIESSTDEEIIKEREIIAAAMAKVAERKKALEETAKAALVPDDFDPEAKTKEFKELRVKVRTLLMQSKGTLQAFDQDVSELDEALDNLPNISGGISASGKSPAELQAIRDWANANGYEVAERGRIKADVVAAYDKRNDTPENMAS
jgi:hypothetical protein